MPNAEYAPKLEYLDILVQTIDISELVGDRCGDRQMLSTCNRMNVCEECSLFSLCWQRCIFWKSHRISKVIDF